MGNWNNQELLKNLIVLLIIRLHVKHAWRMWIIDCCRFCLFEKNAYLLCLNLLAEDEDDDDDDDGAAKECEEEAAAEDDEVEEEDFEEEVAVAVAVAVAELLLTLLRFLLPLGLVLLLKLIFLGVLKLALVDDDEFLTVLQP